MTMITDINTNSNDNSSIDKENDEQCLAGGA